MTYVKKLIAPVLCLVLGCAGGAALGGATAQTWPEPANVQRWQQECELARGRLRDENVNRVMAERGATGWEYVGIIGDGPVPFLCFKRPAQ